MLGYSIFPHFVLEELNFPLLCVCVCVAFSFILCVHIAFFIILHTGVAFSFTLCKGATLPFILRALNFCIFLLIYFQPWFCSTYLSEIFFFSSVIIFLCFNV